MSIPSASALRRHLCLELSSHMDWNAPSALCARKRLLFVMSFSGCRSKFLIRGPRHVQRRVKCIASTLGRTGVGAHLWRALRGGRSMLTTTCEHAISTRDRRLCTSLCGLERDPEMSGQYIVFKRRDICNTILSYVQR
jgi:hypothetical protein